MFEIIFNFFVNLFKLDEDNTSLEKISGNKNTAIDKLENIVDSQDITISILLALANNPSINKDILMKIANHDKSYKENGNLIYMQNNNIYTKVQNYDKSFYDKFYFAVSKNSFFKRTEKQITELLKDPIEFITKLKLENKLNTYFHIQDLINNLKDLPFDVKIKILKELGVEVEHRFEYSKNKEIFFNNNERLLTYYNNKINNISTKQIEQNIQKQIVNFKTHDNKSIILTKFQKENYYDKIANQNVKAIINNLANPEFLKKHSNTMDLKIMNITYMFNGINFDNLLDKRCGLILINDLVNDIIGNKLINSYTEKKFKDFISQEAKHLTHEYHNEKDLNNYIGNENRRMGIALAR